MKNKIKNILEFIFGTNQKVRFKRIVFILLLIVFSIILTLNVSCGFKDGKFFFVWQPAAEIKINKGGGSE